MLKRYKQGLPPIEVEIMQITIIVDREPVDPKRKIMRNLKKQF
jgi:hypothetical protein